MKNTFQQNLTCICKIYTNQYYTIQYTWHYNKSVVISSTFFTQSVHKFIKSLWVLGAYVSVCLATKMPSQLVDIRHIYLFILPYSSIHSINDFIIPYLQYNATTTTFRSWMFSLLWSVLYTWPCIFTHTSISQWASIRGDRS